MILFSVACCGRSRPFGCKVAHLERKESRPHRFISHPRARKLISNDCVSRHPWKGLCTGTKLGCNPDRFLLTDWVSRDSGGMSLRRSVNSSVVEDALRGIRGGVIRLKMLPVYLV